MRRGLILVLVASALASAGLAAARPDVSPRPTCLGATATIVGTKFSDVLRGTGRNDVIVGLGGPDLILGGPGNDRICGGPGRDRVDGGSGNNRCAEAEVHLNCGPPSVTIVSATASGGNRVELLADHALSGVAPTDGFGVTVNGAPVAVRSAAATGRRVVLTLAAPALSDDEMRVAIREAARTELRVHIGALAVTNRNPTGCSFLAGAPAADRVSEGPTNLALFPSARGTLRAVFLSLDFPDAPAGDGPIADGSALGTWAAEDSYARLSLTVDNSDRWFRMPDSWESYGLAPQAGAAAFPDFVTTALKIADPWVDFSRYDVVFLLGTASGLPETAFTVPRGRGVVLDGVEVRFVGVGSASSANAPASLGRLLGLPHLGRDFAAWDPLGSGGARSFTAWHKRKLGWIDPEQMRCVRAGSVDTVLAPLSLTGGMKAVVVPTGPSTAIVVENRSPVGHDSDSCPPGALIYAVEPAGLRPRPAGDTTADDCAALYGVGTGQRASYGDATAEVTVLEARDRDLLVRVTRR